MGSGFKSAMSSGGTSFTGPMGLIAIAVISIVGMVILFGLTAFFYFIKFMNTDFMQTGVPVWALLIGAYVILIMNRNRRYR